MPEPAELKKFPLCRYKSKVILEFQDKHYAFPSFQSTLRELEKKVELERVQYEELMLELTLTKKVNLEPHFQRK